MSTTIVPPPPRIPMVDARGNITRPWSDWLLNEVVRRIGGLTALTNIELEELAGAATLTPSIEPLPAQCDLQPAQQSVIFPDNEHGRLQALEAEVATLRTMIEGLQQGYQL